MANTKKRIFYPTTDGAVKPYYDNAATQLIGAVGVKYGTDAATIAALTGHKTQVPLVIQKAFDDAQQAQSSTNAKNTELSTAKLDLLRELNRITRLPIWDETDGQLLGIRVEHTHGDPNTAKPIIGKITELPDQIILDWVKGEWGGVIIESIDMKQQQQPPNPMPTPTPTPPVPPTSGDPGWKQIGTDQKSPYEDTAKNQSHQPEVRYYRMRYTDKNGKAIGLYSEIAQVVAEVY